MTRRQLAIGGAVAALALLGLFVGAASISPSDVWSAILARLGIGDAERLADAIVWDIRMPRVIGGILVGGTLGASGAALQGLLRNSIAEPYLLGLSSAAGFGLVVGAWITPWGSWPVLPAAFACLAAGAAAVLIRRLAAGAVDANSLVLSGIAVGFALLAWTLIVIFSVDSPRLPTFTYFVFGGLGATTWKIVAVGAPLAIVGQALLVSRSRQLDLIALGDVQAATLGVDVAM
ncbi:MAG: iron chelate uptake ABC transporter family permease subunit, partial [Acidimicrobiia bacterium]|nr:iron chelate uptake ABC transporter family permease subunit [Acidimicrobiia bacterium]